MAEFLEVKCPDCGSTLFINRSTGKVVESRKPVEGQMEGEDRFEALIRKAKGREQEVMNKFAQAQEREKSKFERLNALFKDGQERVKQKGDDKPDVRDIDLD